MKIALLHYAYTPVIGGVEFIMEQHAGVFDRRGHQVKVVCGAGARREHRDVGVVVIPELSAGSEACATSQRVLHQPGGEHLPEFAGLKGWLKERFLAELADADIVFVHNLFVMHFNLAATAALWEVADELGGQVRMVSWVHDIAAINPDYTFPDPEAYPWNLLRRAPPAPVEVVVISAKRQRQYAALTGLPTSATPVVPNGVEFLRLLTLTDHMSSLVRRFGLLYRDVVLVHPARILRRKNVEFGIRVLAELKALGLQCTYLITGAPDPHNAESLEYGNALRALIHQLGVSEQFLFVSEHFPVADADLNGLYQVADVLFLPSRQEGFGLPLLEAAIFRIPAFCPRIEPMRSILNHNVTLFELEDPPGEVAIRIMEVLGRSPGFLSRKEVMRKYSWDRLFDQMIEPMFLPRHIESPIPHAPPRSQRANA
ncbi:glycosyltransferase family 4 protein [soil metagenome]